MHEQYHTLFPSGIRACERVALEASPAEVKDIPDGHIQNKSKRISFKNRYLRMYTGNHSIARIEK